MLNKKNILFAGLFILTNFKTKASEFENNSSLATQKLQKYEKFLVEGTYSDQDFNYFSKYPKSRYYSFKFAFEYFEQINGKIIVELGTTRSFVHGGLIGCNSNDTRYWTPNNPENWDWGAGAFTLMAGECLSHMNPKIYTVDLASDHIQRCRLMTQEFKNITHVISDSRDFIRTLPAKSVDLLYLDTGDMTPIEPTAQLQLSEAQLIVERDIISDNGIIVIDDVRNPTPKKFGEKSDLGKSKYALEFFLSRGFEILIDEYQVILKRKNK